MRKFAVLFILVVSAVAQADLLDRIRLEDAVRTRIDSVVKVYDPKARVLLHFNYKSYDGELPGMATTESKGYNPTRIEATDVARVSVDIFTEDPSLIAEEAKDFIYRVVPAEKSKVTIEIKQVQSPNKDTSPVEIQNLTPEALSNIARESLNTFLKILGGLLAGLFVCSVLVNMVSSRRRTSEMKEQIALLAKSISEMSIGGSGPVAAVPAAARDEHRGPTSLSLSTEVSTVEKMPVASLKEIFADCYWCERDGYAAWLWKKIPAEKRAELLQSVEFMKDYCASFLTAEPEELAHHEHPFYLDPSPLSPISQGDVSVAVRKDFSLWHRLSPLRQQNLPLSLEEKLKAMQSSPSKASLPSKPSVPRVLKLKPAWGTLSVADETAVFHNPELIPAGLRSDVKSLVWLARKDQSSIEKILSKYDARALAAAWVGPDEVLKKLESALPEKKLKLLETYREKTAPARTSSAFLGLVDEGLKDDAA